MFKFTMTSEMMDATIPIIMPYLPWFLINAAIKENKKYDEIVNDSFKFVYRYKMKLPPIKTLSRQEKEDFFNRKIQEGVLLWDGESIMNPEPTEEEMKQTCKIFNSISHRFFQRSVIPIFAQMDMDSFVYLCLMPRDKQAEYLSYVSLFAANAFVVWWFPPTRWLYKIAVIINNLNEEEE
jgi:hypothetical protein